MTAGCVLMAILQGAALHFGHLPRILNFIQFNSDHFTSIQFNSIHFNRKLQEEFEEFHSNPSWTSNITTSVKTNKQTYMQTKHEQKH